MQNKQVLFGQNTKLNAIFVFSYNVHEHKSTRIYWEDLFSRVPSLKGDWI